MHYPFTMQTGTSTPMIQEFSFTLQYNPTSFRWPWRDVERTEGTWLRERESSAQQIAPFLQHAMSTGSPCSRTEQREEGLRGIYDQRRQVIVAPRRRGVWRAAAGGWSPRGRWTWPVERSRCGAPAMRYRPAMVLCRRGAVAKHRAPSWLDGEIAHGGAWFRWLQLD